MIRIKIILSITVFSFLLILTSIIKNQTREIEKKILNFKQIINSKEKDFNESQLDFYYLTSPSVVEKKIELIDNKQYIPMESSNIFLKMDDFTDLEKIVIQDIENEKKLKKKDFNINQSSFYFEDYLETNKKIKFLKKNNYSQDRIYILFFLFFSLIFIFSIRIIHVSLNKVELFNQENSNNKFHLQRRDIIDRNGSLVSRSIRSYHAAINPNLVKNKENLIIKLRLNFPELPIKTIEKKLIPINIFI